MSNTKWSVATEAGVSSWATLGRARPRAWSLTGAQEGGGTGDAAVAGIFCRGWCGVIAFVNWPRDESGELTTSRRKENMTRLTRAKG